MPNNPNDDRLSRITTNWGVLREAHGAPTRSAAARAAQELLLLRYGPAARRYLNRVTGDLEAAADLFQEFGLAVIEGKLKGADPDRGRFRDYVKAVLRHLVAKYHAKRRKGPQPVGCESSFLDTVAAPESTDDTLDIAWRDNLLARTWAALADANPRANTVLRLHVADPKVPSHELATRLSATQGKPITAEAVRQVISRARKEFASLLVGEVRQSLADPTDDEVRQELAELGLLKYCNPPSEE